MKLKKIKNIKNHIRNNKKLIKIVIKNNKKRR